MTLGSLMLFQPGVTGIQVGLGLIIPAAIITALFFAIVVGMGLRAQSRKVVTGIEGLVGETGTVSIDLNPNGKVLVHGEIWTAHSPQPTLRGSRVKVTAVNGMELTVEPLPDQAS